MTVSLIMQIVQIQENRRNEWNQAIISSPYGNFLQSFEWGKFQKSLDRKIWRLAILEKINNNLSSAYLLTTIIKHNLPFGKSYLYCPRGPIVEKSKIDIIKLLLKEIKDIAKKEKAVFFRIEPPFLKKEIDFSLLIKNDKSLIVPVKSVQPKDTLILDLTKSEEELLSQMKQKTRYNIRLAKRKKVKIISSAACRQTQGDTSKEFERFWKLLKETSLRDKFQLHPKKHYQKILEVLSYSNNGPKAQLFFAEYKGEFIAANIVVFFGKTATYLHGATSNKFRKVMAPYLLHWQQICEAKKRGCEYYDFWGIEKESGTKNQQLRIKENKNWQGITRFKKGFGGKEISYAKTYDLVYQPRWYKLYNFAKYFKL